MIVVVREERARVQGIGPEYVAHLVDEYGDEIGPGSVHDWTVGFE